MNQEVFKVQANADQVAKFPAVSDLKWVPKSGDIANRVYCLFNNKEDAKQLYDLLKANKLVAFRNWLD